MSSETPKFIRVGDNPEQSLIRPLINETAERLGIDGLRIEPYDLELDTDRESVSGQFFDRLAELGDDGLLGVSVTMPLTTKIVPEFLTAESARIDEKYLGLLGAIDAVTANPGDPDRPWTFHNTDALAVKQTFSDYEIDLSDRNFLIFGAGGAARAAAFAVAQQRPANIVIANRNLEKAQKLANAVDDVANRKSPSACSDGYVGTGIQAVKLGDLDSETPVSNWTVSSADIVINGTPIGQRGHAAEEKMPLSALQLASILSPGVVILDTVYDPARTPLIRTANPTGKAWIPYRKDITEKKLTAIQGTQWALRKAMIQFLKFNDALVSMGESSPLSDKKISLAQELMTEILAKEINLRTNE